MPTTPHTTIASGPLRGVPHYTVTPVFLMTSAKKNAVIFDLDGTLCDVRHRRHFVTEKPKNWKAWNEEMVNDTLNEPVALVYHLLKQLTFYDVILVSGRSEDYREKTEKWLKDHAIAYDALYMRAHKDNRDDAVVKSEIADEIEKTHNIFCVFDDRKRVVDMWTNRGIWVFDVGQGKGDF